MHGQGQSGAYLYVWVARFLTVHDEGQSGAYSYCMCEWPGLACHTPLICSKPCQLGLVFYTANNTP